MLARGALIQKHTFQGCLTPYVLRPIFKGGLARPGGSGAPAPFFFAPQGKILGFGAKPQRGMGRQPQHRCPAGRFYFKRGGCRGHFSTETRSRRPKKHRKRKRKSCAFKNLRQNRSQVSPAHSRTSPAQTRGGRASAKPYGEQKGL